MPAPYLTLSRGSTTLTLDDGNGITVTPGVQGLDTPPVSLARSSPADFDGALVTNVRYAPREIFLPLAIQGSDTVALRERVRTLASLLNPQNGEVTLTVTNAAESSGELLAAGVVDGIHTNFDGGSGETLTTETTTVRTGTNALKVTTSSTPSTILVKSANRVSVTAGNSYTAQVWVRADSSTANVQVSLTFYNSGGSVIATQYSLAATSSASQWTRLLLEVPAPAGATAAGIGAYASNYTHYWDDFSLTEGASERQISGYLSSPIAETVTVGEALTWRRLGVNLLCPDPLFLGPQLAAVAVSNTITVTNLGDAVTWPRWSLLLASSYPLTITNTSAPGAPSLYVDDTYSSLILDTNPRSLDCYELSSGNSAWDAIDPDSVLWPLYPGDNEITGVNFGGLSSGSFTYRPRWLTAW